MTDILRVLYLSRVRQNPYVKLMATGVERADGRVRSKITPHLSWGAMVRFRPHIVHIHWVELQYQRGQPAQTARALKWLLCQLTGAQRLGVKLVYTVHNLSQHEDRYPALNAQANEWLFAHADAIHVHDGHTAREVDERYGRQEGVVVIPHGSYRGVYANDIDQASARGRLGLATAASLPGAASPSAPTVYLCLGQIRPYKGIERLIRAFAANPDPQIRLIIAGHAETTAYGDKIRRLAGADPRILVHAAYIPDEDVQIYFNAADVCVLPYRRATTSGAALLAFSFGKPVVAPALGPFPELITPATGVLFDPPGEDPGAEEETLGQALEAARRLDATAVRRATQALAASRDWTTLGSQFAALYHSLRQPRPIGPPLPNRPPNGALPPRS